MRKVKFTLCFLGLMLFIMGCSFLSKNKLNYSVVIKKYDENNSHIEYPQIKGLKDKKMQDTINTLLKEQVFFGARDFRGDYMVDFSYPNYFYNFESGAGLTNNDMASFWYSFQTSGEVYFEDGSVARHTSRFYCITINMKTGQVIELPDFMIVDERLLDSSDGDSTKPDYDGVKRPVFHNFKDLFKIYTSENEEDIYHIYTPEEVIEDLTDSERETNWYIDKDKNVVFYYSEDSMKIPYTRLTDIIRPHYLEILSRR